MASQGMIARSKQRPYAARMTYPQEQLYLHAAGLRALEMGLLAVTGHSLMRTHHICNVQDRQTNIYKAYTFNDQELVTTCMLQLVKLQIKGAHVEGTQPSRSLLYPDHWRRTATVLCVKYKS